jgi:diadenosine tetraphosphate (Ap4A) HIT family hydrolase
MTFSLDPRLEADTVPVVELELSTVRLMQDATYPWLVLVPRLPGLVEILDLEAAERALLMEEIAAAGAALSEATKCHKLNVAALGNQVPQLHVHVIARFRTDPAWPEPVWGRHPAKPWQAEAREALVRSVATRLKPPREA